MASTMMAKTFLGASLAKAVPTNGKVYSRNKPDNNGTTLLQWPQSSAFVRLGLCIYQQLPPL